MKPMHGVTHLSVRDTSAVPSARKYDQHFYRRLPVQPPQYSGDETDLIPVTKKQGVVAVALADAKKLRIASKTKPHATFSPTELPTVRFRGSLMVSEAPDDEVAGAPAESAMNEGEALSAAPADEVVEQVSASATAAPDSDDQDAAPSAAEGAVRHLHITVKRDPKHKPGAKKKKASGAPLLFNPAGVIGMRRARTSDRNPLDPTLTVEAPNTTRPSRTLFVLGLSTVAGLLLVAVLTGLESQVTVSSDTFASSYQFTLASLVELLKTHFAALLVHSFGL